VRLIASGVRSSWAALAVKRRWGVEGGVQAGEHLVEGVGQLLELVVGAVQGDALVEGAFELGQRGEDVEDELAAGGGVHRLLAGEPDAAVGQAGDGVDQVAQRAAQPVKFPDDQGVAGAQLVQELGEGGPVGAGAAGRLGEHSVAAGALEGVDLELRLLVGGGQAGTADQVSHAADRLTTLRQRWLCDVNFGHGF
jgi:hypothetical protein